MYKYYNLYFMNSILIFDCIGRHDFEIFLTLINR